jgi:hypothetical protein
MKNYLIIIIIFTFVLFVTPKSGWAQQVSVNVKPGITTITTKPGRTINQTITLINSGDPQVYTFRLYSLEPADAQGNMTLLPLKKTPVTFEISDPSVRIGTPVLLQTNQKKTLQISITTPDVKDASLDGEYIYALVAETEKPLPIEGNVNTRISAGLGSVFFVRILNENKDTKSVDISLFKAVTQFSIPFGKTSLEFINSNSPIPFVILTKNKGPFSVTPQGQLSIRNVVNKSSENFQLKQVTVYPGTDRVLSVQGYELQGCEKRYGEQNCSEQYSFVHPGFSFGLFEASGKISFGGDSPVLYSQTFFIIVPFLLVGIVLLSMIAAIVLLIHEWRKHIQQAKTPHHPKKTILP